MSEELIGTKFNIRTKFLWHSTQIYCLTFDKKGKYVFTGGDDGVLRIYSIAKDRLMKELSDQNSNEFEEALEEVCRSIDFQTTTEANIEALLERFAICDISVNHENTLVAAGKHNGSILVWNLQTFDLIVKFEEQTFPIRSIIFGAAIFNEDMKYLISTSEDGFIFFYVYNYKTLKFEPKALHRRSKYEGERAVNICVDMTTGGLLLGLMHTFGIKQEISGPKSKKGPFVKSNIQSAIRICSLSNEMGLKEEWKTTYQKSHSECVYSLRFAHNTFRFASACDKDTNAFIWTFDKSNKKWDSIIIGINATADTKKLLRGKSKQSVESVFVEEIAFSCDDKYMITILSDVSIKVWNSESGELVRHFKYHYEKTSVVDCHPSCGHIFLSAGYDSNIYLYDIIKGNILQQFDCSLNSKQIDGNSSTDNLVSIEALNPKILQCAFSPDGQAIAATDNYGNLTIFSLESRKETDCLDKLEEVLFRMHSENEENCLTEMGITASEEDSKFIKAMFEYETDLLKGFEKPSPLKQTQNNSEKKSDIKSVKKLDFDSESSDIQIKKVKSSPNSRAKTPQKRTLAKKSIQKTPPIKSEVKPDSPPTDVEKTPNSIKAKTGAIAKQSKFAKQIFIEILNEIFENPSSRPFQINDELLYPTFRKEISDADLSLTSIREELLLSNRATFSKFNKDVNKVIENAKSFYKHIDEEVYEMALTLETFYCNKMETQFGSSFKFPKKMDSSDDESDNSCDKRSQTALSEPKTKNKDNFCDKSKDNSRIDSSVTSLRSQLVQKQSPKQSPIINGNKTPKRKQIKNKSSEMKNTSNRKRTQINERTESDSELTSGKRTKTTKKLLNSSTVIQNIDDTNDQKKQNEDTEENIDTDVPEDVTKDIAVDLNLEISAEELQSNDSQTEQPNDFGVEAEKEEEMHIPVEESLLKPESLINGSPTVVEVNSCDNQKQSSQLKNCLFCIFCEKIFWAVSEAKSHYISHLCPLKCSKCNEMFTTYDLYLNHECGHPKIPNNIEWCRQYSDSINWIEKFIDFQQTEEIESFEKINKENKKCIVCEKVDTFRTESSRRKKEIKSIDAYIHLEKHLKYVPQFQCLICLLNNDKYFYCRNSGEAEQHLSKDHSTYSTSDSSLKYFDGSIPMLDQMILQ